MTRFAFGISAGVSALLVAACPAAAVAGVPALLAEAQAALRDKRDWDALRAFGEVLRLEPDNAEARRGAADILDRNRGSHGAAALAGVPDWRAADMAAARVRWGAEVQPEDVARRFEGTDRAIADLDALLAKLKADPTADPALVRRIRLDRMVALRDRVQMAEVIAEAQALASQMDQLESRLRLKALRAQRLELYSLRRHHEIGDDVLSEVLRDLDLSEANLGTVK